MISTNQKAFIETQFSFANSMFFMDTCSFLMDSFSDFASLLTPLLSQDKRHLYIHQAVISELEHISCTRNHPRRCHALYALREIECMDRVGIIHYITATDASTPADNQFLETFLRLRKEKAIRLITQDFNLAKDCVLLNGICSSTGFQIESFKLTAYGGLKKFSFHENTIFTPRFTFTESKFSVAANY